MSGERMEGVCIQTENITEEETIKEVRYMFGLDNYPLNDMDDYLILLAFTPIDNDINNISDNTKIIWMEKYGIDNNESLEFYGDRVLYGVMSSVLFKIFGLGCTPHFLTQTMSSFTNNRILTELMLNKGGCFLLRTNNYTIENKKKKFHNKCADCLEALIGAIFIHLLNKGLDYNYYIAEWLLSNTNIMDYINDYILNIDG
ncbi:Ribonuclease III [Orpheovirus IHUMI-LCC2]|uniref:Ribonuclease III n=1 Tax=Orpheovirus IHUMI-LCC2 TaxID=2023057 RepID=A0A2I2L565_9VIRU|nr:Ribonuclease III [Orpheovirus IHUMI-LCC2]SNW62692.1 Ribonuclease III [Orpheovirus IHUMI-LCC2]